MAVASIGVAAAISLGLAAPAHAAWVSYESEESLTFGDTKTDGLDTSTFYLKDANMSDAWLLAHPQSSTYNSNWDGHAYMAVDFSDYSSFAAIEYTYPDGVETNCVQDMSGDDILIQCDELEILPGVIAHPQVRYFDEHNTERIVWYYENTTGSDVEIVVRERANSECDGSGVAQASNGDVGAAFSTDINFMTARWFVQRVRDTSGGNCGVELNAWKSQDADIEVTNTLAMNYDGQAHEFIVPIPSGQTVALAFFYSNFWIDDQNTPFVSGDVTDIQYLERLRVFDNAVEFADDNYTRWTSWMGEGLTSEEKAQVINWVTAEPTSTEGLANTGSTDLTIPLAALVGATLFGALALRNRRRTF
jgi:hypothetical protein